MVKAFKRMEAGLKEVLAIARGEKKPARVYTPSCGSVFCDIKLKPRKHDSKLMHYVRAEKKWVPCLRVYPASKPYNKWDYLKTKAQMKAYIEEMESGFTPTVTRFEVIDEAGRAYTRYGVTVMLSFQDDGRTLKAFIKDRPGKRNTPGGRSK